MGVNSNSQEWALSTAPYRSAAFGAQPYSKRKSAPQFSFGTSTVEARASEYLGKEFCPHQIALAVSPGPALYGRASSAPMTSSGPGSNLKWARDALIRTFPNLPSHSFKGTPGPGSYGGPMLSTVGKTFASASMPSLPSYTWTRGSTRENHRCAYISPGHERELLGTCSPGPHVVGREAFDSMGIQASSMRRSNARFAPPKAQRFMTLKGADKSSWPGPASYNF